MAMANTDDALALVAKRLVETDTIGAIIAPGAVYTAYPRAGQDDVPMPCIVLAFESGDMADANLSMAQAVVTIWTYSRTSSAEAGALHQLVMSTLQREIIRSSVTLAGGSLANPCAVSCDFRGNMGDMWIEMYGAWSRRSNWLLTYISRT